MPITETPPSPPSETPSRQPDAPALKSSGRYDGLEHHELLHIVDQLEDERARARFREGIWIALLLHVIVFWFLAYAPRVLFHAPRVISPVDVFKQRAKDFQYLDMPPDLVKKQKPKDTNIISDKDRVAQTKNPVIDKKTLAELQAMERAGHPNAPAAQPAPQPQQTAPGPQAPQVAQQQPQAPQPQPKQSQPLQNSQQAMLEAPKPAPPKPSFAAGGGGSAGDMLRQAMRAAAQNPGDDGNFGDNAPVQHSGLNTGMEVLSDTMGVDFGPYLQRLHHDIQMAWEPLIPEAARPPLLKQGVVAIRFTILPGGKLGAITLEGPSGDVSLDRAAWGGILGASPFPPLPKTFKGPKLELRCFFLYNKKPPEQ
ncbi:MAG: energy transducer TonB family protein [Acidobacteriaceae bacterium]